MLASASMISSWQSPNILASQDVWPPNMLARPGTPRDPKSHLFATNWVAIQPFSTSEAGFDAEFRRGSRQIGPTPSNSTFFGPFFEPKMPQISILAFFRSNMGENKVGIQAPGPPRRDPGRNSVPDPGCKVPNGGMATHLVAKRCDLGSLGVPGPARTPWWRTDLQEYSEKSR